MFWVAAYWAPSTWFFPAWSVSWRYASAIWYTPVAPSGCPLAFSPPKVLMGSSPPLPYYPALASLDPSPRLEYPIASRDRAPTTEKASCTSARLTFFGASPA